MCTSCGGRDITERPQAMTRHSRGTQLSIIGWRQIPLCRVCDATALEASLHENVPAPDGYVSAALHAPGAKRRPGQGTKPPAAPSAVPTVRQAIAAFLADASGEVDRTAMLLLGTHLGSYNRLGTMEGESAVARIERAAQSGRSQRLDLPGRQGTPLEHDVYAHTDRLPFDPKD